MATGWGSRTPLSAQQSASLGPRQRPWGGGCRRSTEQGPSISPEPCLSATPILISTHLVSKLVPWAHILDRPAGGQSGSSTGQHHPRPVLPPFAFLGNLRRDGGRSRALIPIYGNITLSPIRSIFSAFTHAAPGSPYRLGRTDNLSNWL